MNIQKEAIATLQLGGPLIAAQLAQISINFVDTVMAGNLSPQALAAVAVGGNVWFAIVVVCIGLLISVSPSVAQLFGAGKYEEIGPCVRQGLWLSQAAGVLSLIVLQEVRPVLEWFNVAPELVPTTIGFVRAISWGLPAFCGYQVLRSFSEGISMTKPVMYVSLLALIGNLTGDYILMYGKLGMPALGAPGCGVASAIVMWLMFLVMAIYIKAGAQYRRYGIFNHFELPRWKEMSALLKLGAPIAVSLFMEASLFSVVALLMGSLGSTVVAGHQIAINVASITFMVPLGLAMAISVRVGQAIGRGEPDAARFAGFVGIMLAGIFMTFSALVMFLAPEFIAGIYTNDPAVKQMAVTLLFMAAIFQIFDGLQVASNGALRGLKDTRIPMVITLFAYWGIGLPLAYVLGISRGGGPRSLWIGFICGLVAAAVLLNTRFHLVASRLTKRDA